MNDRTPTLPPPSDPRLASPRDGDLVVARDTSRPGHFAISQVPGQPQFSLSSEHAALEVAEALGRSHGVDVWVVAGAITACRHRLRDPMLEASGAARNGSGPRPGMSVG